MGIEADAMTLKKTGTMRASKAARHADRTYDVRDMSTSAILWHVSVKHKFGLVCTAFAVYVAFSLFGTLIVGLFQSL